MIGPKVRLFLSTACLDDYGAVVIHGNTVDARRHGKGAQASNFDVSTLKENEYLELISEAIGQLSDVRLCVLRIGFRYWI